MIRAIVWKELREQGLIAAMLAAMGGGLMVAAAMFADPPSPNAPQTDVVAALGAGRLLTLMLVVTAGMVCGGALFAAEKESGTMSFLEEMPADRWELWRAKLTAGLTLGCAEVLALILAAAVLGLGDVAFLGRLPIYALLAFSWGMLGSTLARTTLGSVGVAIPAATLAAFVILLPVSIFFPSAASGMPRPVGWILFELLMVATPLVLSAWRFTAPDRARAADTLPDLAPANAATLASVGRRSGVGIRALVWLALRQLQVSGPVLSAFALAFGLAILLPDMQPLLLWPAIALTAGVLAGVTAFADEQSHRTALFWGEHRLPIGRGWFVKIGLHLGLLVWLLLLVALPCLIRSQFETEARLGRSQTRLATVFHSRLFDELRSQGWKYLLVPAAYGFAFGHLCGLLFRKLVVACGVAVMLGGVAAAMWGPSILAGGVKHWQVWLPAVAILLTGRLLMRAWTADRVAERGSLMRLGGGAVAAASIFAAGLVYRIVQVPDPPGGEDDLTFVASLPTYDENVAGREFRAAADRYARTVAAVQQEPDQPPEWRSHQWLDEHLVKVIRYGWSAEDAELAKWLDRVCADTTTSPDEKPWPSMAATAGERPIGVYDPPLLVSTATATAVALENARWMGIVLLARGLQSQTTGDPGEFVSAFRTAVALGRGMRKGGGMLAVSRGIDLERMACSAAGVWLDGPVGSVDRCRAVIAIATDADDPKPFDPLPHNLADRYAIRGLMQAPGSWLTINLTGPLGTVEQAASEADFVAVAWSVPWEKERTRRLVGLAPEASSQVNSYALVSGRPGSNLLVRSRSAADSTESEMQLRVALRAAILKAAIRAFQAEHGRAPSNLAELVAHRYLAKVPVDPFAEDRSFGYRVSDGEVLRDPPRVIPAGPSPPAGGPKGAQPPDRFVLAVRAGQAVLWSVGPDRIDQGGHVPPGIPRPEDIVFVVPLP